MIKVELKDGKVLEVEKGKSILEVAKQISEGLARMATCARINDQVVDLRTGIQRMVRSFYNRSISDSQTH